MLPPKDKWTPLNGYPLSEKEMLMSLEPSKQMHITNIVNYEVSNKRVIKVISERSSMSFKCSSVVSIDSSTGSHFEKKQVYFFSLLCLLPYCIDGKNYHNLLLLSIKILNMT